MSGGVLRVLTPRAAAKGELVLRPGEAVEPVSMGTEGEWRLRGLGVRATHAWLRFDGSRLELTAAERSSIVLVDGRPLALGWAPIDRACRIELGTVTLAFEPAERVADGPASEPRDAVSVISHPKPSRRPAVSATAMLVAAIVVMAVAVIYLAVHASHRGPAVVPEIVAVNAAAPPAAPAPAVAAAAPAPAHADSVVVYPVRHLPPPRSGKSLERLAADAFHAGDRRRAAILYRDLATRQPDNLAFATAADMLEAMR